MAFNRKKELFAPDVEGLIKELTGFKENEKNFQEVARYFYQNVIHHNFATVDFGSVQKSLEGIIEKLKLHGLKSRSSRLQELIERFVAVNLSEHSQLQWNILLLMLRLSYRPTSVSEESLKVVHSSLKPAVEEEEEEEDINWPEYLHEGWQRFHCPDNDSDEWSDEEEDLSNEEFLNYAESTSDKSTSVSTRPSYGGIPHPSLWRIHPPPMTKRESIRSIIQEASKSEHWMRCHVQQPWWTDLSSKCIPDSTYPTAHTCEIWEKTRAHVTPTASSLHVISESKVLQEILWMLQVPTETSVFCTDEMGKFCVKPGVSLPSTVPEGLRLVLCEFCPYFKMVHEIRVFEETLNDLECSDKPAPFTLKAYCAELLRQLEYFNKAVIEIETRLNKQEETMTLQCVQVELTPRLKQLCYLYNVHAKATSGWQHKPSWLQVTRLLSVLYTAFLQSSDCSSLETSLNLFVSSFHVYLDITDVWLSEGRLQDSRQEFLVIKEGEHLEVMPYVQEMHKEGMKPVTLITKLVKVMRDAGYTMEIVGQLNKLNALRDTVQNKGWLFKEFKENIKKEISRSKANVIPTPDSSGKSPDVAEELSVLDAQCSNKNMEHDVSGEFSESDLEVCRLFPPGYTVLKGYDTFPESEKDDIVVTREESKPRPPPHLAAISTDALYKQTVQYFLSNPLLAEALKDYFHPEAQQSDSQPPEKGLFVDSSTVIEVACLNRALEMQVELVATRHTIAAKLVTKTLCEEYNLLKHFTVLRSVFFMESGILAQNFYTSLFEKVSYHWQERAKLTVHLQNCVDEFFPGFQNYFAVHIQPTQVTDTFQQAIQALSIAYMVDWPITLVITDEAMECYNKVFKFLLQFKYAFVVLRDIRFSDLSENPNTLRVKQLQALKLMMYHSTNTLHSYFMGLFSFCHQLDTAVRSANSLKDIIKAHDKYLIEVKTHCLQMNKSHLETLMLKLVWQCQDLADLWMMESAGQLTDTEVKDLEHQYKTAYIAVTHCLNVITAEVADDLSPLCKLKSELKHSVPKGWFGEDEELN